MMLSKLTDQLDSIRMKYKVDTFVEHRDLQEKLNAGADAGWELMEMYQCKAVGDREYVTLVWIKE